MASKFSGIFFPRKKDLTRRINHGTSLVIGPVLGSTRPRCSAARELLGLLESRLRAREDQSARPRRAPLWQSAPARSGGYAGARNECRRHRLTVSGRGWLPEWEGPCARTDRAQETAAATAASFGMNTAADAGLVHGWETGPGGSLRPEGAVRAPPVVEVGIRRPLHASARGRMRDGPGRSMRPGP